MQKLQEVAYYVRSKNAGPFWLTIDIFFSTTEAYEKIKVSKNINVQNVARLYHVPEDKVKVFYVDSINVIKFSFPRPKPQGNKYENDMHGGQQYVRLINVEV